MISFNKRPLNWLIPFRNFKFSSDSTVFDCCSNYWLPISQKSTQFYHENGWQSRTLHCNSIAFFYCLAQFDNRGKIRQWLEPTRNQTASYEPSQLLTKNKQFLHFIWARSDQICVRLVQRKPLSRKQLCMRVLLAEICKLTKEGSKLNNK